MRSKAPLALIEQVIMLLVFVLAAALCLNCFIRADARSEESAARDSALLELQNMAETLKHCGGDFQAAAELGGGVWDGEELTVLYDAGWNETDTEPAYVLCARRTHSAHPLLGRAELSVLHDGEPLASLDVCWQEVTPDE